MLRDVTLSLSSGARVVVLGVNGCGKTTLLKALDGLLFPSAGTIAYDGEHLTAKRLDQVDFRRRFRSEVALLFQNVDAMLFNPTVADEIAFGPRQLGLTDVDARVEKWAEAFDVMGLLRRPPFELWAGRRSESRSRPSWPSSRRFCCSMSQQPTSIRPLPRASSSSSRASPA